MERSDLTHEFFAQLLDGSLNCKKPIAGRFRYYLLDQVKHFLSHVRERQQTLKRGAGRVIQTWEEQNEPAEKWIGGSVEACRIYDTLGILARIAKGDFAASPTIDMGFERNLGNFLRKLGFPTGSAGRSVFDAAFDRGWALTLIQSTLSGLSTSSDDNSLIPFLTTGLDGSARNELAKKWNLSESAIKTALARRRKRFRVRLRTPIAQTLSENPTEQEINEELGYLIAAFCSERKEEILNTPPL